MKRYHVISISVLVGLILGLSVSKAAEAGEHRDRAICISSTDTVSIYDNGIVYASNATNALIRLDMATNHPEISTAREWAIAVMQDSPQFKCKVLR
ncbi:TPA: hypothetical protein ACXEZB_004381 [Escherichia coli]